MPSKDIGKTITDIHYLKNKNIIFFGTEKLEISKSAPTEIALYIGKVLTDKDIKKLTLISKQEKDFDYAYKLLSRGDYSLGLFREKLTNHKISIVSANIIVNKLMELGFLNDVEYAKQKVDYYEEVKHFGERRIIDELYADKVDEKVIRSFSFPRSGEIRKAMYFIPQLDKKYHGENFINKKSHIFASLARLGFSNEIINECMKKVSVPSLKEQKIKLRKDFEASKLRLKRKYKGEELKQKIIESLLRKGYQYAQIKELED